MLYQRDRAREIGFYFTLTEEFPGSVFEKLKQAVCKNAKLKPTDRGRSYTTFARAVSLYEK